MNSESPYTRWAGSPPGQKQRVYLGLVADVCRGQEMKAHCQCLRMNPGCLNQGGNVAALHSFISHPWYCLRSGHGGAQYRAGLHTGLAWVEERDCGAVAANHLVKHLLRFSST